MRFDNRDIGRSTKLDGAHVPEPPRSALGRRETAAYLLSDMAADTVGLMDHLGIDSAHVAGSRWAG